MSFAPRFPRIPAAGLCALACALVLAGCANQPGPRQSAPSPAPVKAPVLTTIDNRPFASETLYALLVAEMALDRRRYDIGLNNYLQQAGFTRDPHVIERAARIARALKAHQPALEMSTLWLTIDPANPDARLIALSELIEADRLDEAFDLAEQQLLNGQPTAFDSIAVSAEQGDSARARALLKRYTALLQSHPDIVDLWLGQSILLQQDGQLTPALAAARRAVELDAGSVRSVFQEIRVLQAQGKNDAVREKLHKLVSDNPDNIGLRARYARIVSTFDLAEAREQFLVLHQQAPSDAEILYSLALVEQELGEFDDALQRFQLLLQRGQYVASSHFHIGELLEQLGRSAEALDHYRSVEQGRNYIPAMVKATNLLIHRGDLEQALALIQAEKAGRSGSTLESLYQLEGDILSEAGQMSAAEGVLSQGIAAQPNSTRLLYARAMLYTRIDYIPAAERDLKTLLSLAPNNAAALNALGYTLADRTERYQEAYEYIKQAFELTPDDPAVLDSMGWVAYRMGDMAEALSKLQRAMQAMPDHEIAAHLGEVLWVMGRHDEAVAVWKRGLSLQPQSPIIHRTVHRLDAKLD